MRYSPVGSRKYRTRPPLIQFSTVRRETLSRPAACAVVRSGDGLVIESCKEGLPESGIVIGQMAVMLDDRVADATGQHHR
jgi:hypothetical protein